MIKGERINFRPQRTEDHEYIIKYQSDPDVLENFYSGPTIPPGPDGLKKWQEHLSTDKEGFFFVIENKEGEYLGHCSTMWLNWKNRSTYMAIYIGHPDYRSKGYGTEAMKLFLNYMFNEIGLHKVKLNVFGFNKRAVRCYEKAGFKIDGINRKELYRYGEYHDTYAMSITRDEFLRGCGQCSQEI